MAKKPEKKDFGASTGFEPVASALALQCSTSLSYEDPYTGGRPIYLFINWPAFSHEKLEAGGTPQYFCDVTT